MPGNSQVLAAEVSRSVQDVSMRKANLESLRVSDFSGWVLADIRRV